MQFIQLTKVYFDLVSKKWVDGYTVLLNKDLIVCFYLGETPPFTSIDLVTGDSWLVRETVNDILACL